MKKLLYFMSLAIAMTFTACDNHKKVENDLTQENLFGNVKTVVTKEYEVKEKFGEIVKGKDYEMTIQTFDTDGNLTLREISDVVDGEKHIKRIYQVEKSGNSNTIKNISYSYAEDDDDETDYSKIERIWVDEIIQELKEVKVQEETVYVGEEKQLFRKTKYTYVGNNVSEICDYDAEGNLVGKKTYVYKGNDLSEYTEIEYNTKGDITTKKVKTIEDKGTQSKTTKYGKDGNIDYTYREKYDKNGKVIKNKYESGSGKYKSSSKYEYDKFGNRIKNTDESYYSDGSPIIIEFTYQYDNFDNHQNWLTMTYYSNSKVENLYEREIEYY